MGVVSGLRTSGSSPMGRLTMSIVAYPDMCVVFMRLCSQALRSLVPLLFLSLNNCAGTTTPQSALQ